MTMPDVEITGLGGKLKIVGMCVNANEAPGLADECCFFLISLFIVRQAQNRRPIRDLRDYNVICEHGNYFLWSLLTSLVRRIGAALIWEAYTPVSQ